jgi:hypothetical protein
MEKVVHLSDILKTIFCFKFLGYGKVLARPKQVWACLN